ncbi:shikimate dehydrogenase [Microbulbifer thermotolerans]|uniref:shikimate dehydrogenase n=1 Tax=Microbulbifer thermotolerans TaxID=252514 RepID=UPI00224912AD|nr:shikimate dehydrogenase [Microbulbifer thermotolerans]MCX2778482.1 shikimate dehydrogenase [Microbulbifer thermotolerans]MCX2804009.1 shikimate dehydrogenase [Microbulbifer thermotolerans]MCX2830840.1 shikimate dehydrogenase [Microbulbifer thermotolerans]MCX2840865.1 shikimate dehydrogenase [Microbulbifer thermotolerans]
MTDNYAVVGNPIAHSLSPRIHGAFAAQTGQDIHYGRQLVEEGAFAAFARGFFASGGCGLNVTMPFKLDACDFADELTERARAAGAVNTLKKLHDGRVLGDNTDGAGLVSDILDNLGWVIRDRRVLVLGAGGAARGVLLPLLAETPERIHIANRTVAKAEWLAKEFSADAEITAGGLEEFPCAFDLIINASSAGLSNEMPRLPEKILGENCKAYDMVYGAEPTPFMCWAKARGATVADGLGMLVGQAAESFFLWRGLRPDVAPILQQLRKELQNK